MKIAITGASGHIGSNLCPLLIEKGHSLKVLVYKTVKGIPEQNTEIVEGDLTKLEDVENLMKGVDAVIHLAAKIDIGRDTTGVIFKTNKISTSMYA